MLSPGKLKQAQGDQPLPQPSALPTKLPCNLEKILLIEQANTYSKLQIIENPMMMFSASTSKHTQVDHPLLLPSALPHKTTMQIRQGTFDRRR